MQPRTFLNQIDDRRVLEAIAQAEAKSSGEIRVYVSRNYVEDALIQAQTQFVRLGMENTRERNGVLIYFAPQSCNFAVVGDVAVHQRAGDAFWAGIASAMETHLKSGHYTEALLAAIEQVSALLAVHFPRRSDDQNELPNEIERD